MVTKSRVCVGMTGGVDSSVAAYQLVREGYDVVGLTFRNFPADCMSRAAYKCCGTQSVTDARIVAQKLGLPHYVIDEVESFQCEVVDYFVREYANGRTPNPCVICNEKIKFGSLLKKAQSFGADYIATGHYARITRNGRYELRKGLNDQEDQSYFLFSLRQDQLARTLLPLGELEEEETHWLARELALKSYDKIEIEEICFVPDKDYGRFLREGAKLPDRKGDIVTRDGRVVGHHAGIQYFTIGQREGLNLGGQPNPLYVIELDPRHNRVIVGLAEELLRTEFEIANCSWLASDELTGPMESTVKVHYNHKGCPAVVERVSEQRWSVRLPEPQRAITPGQAAVFYQGDLVVGGGWIC